MPTPVSSRSPTVAAALSLLFPGLGQLYAGHRRRAALFALPMLVVVGLIVFAIARGWMNVLSALLEVEVLVGLLVGLAALFVYHAAAIIDAYQLARAGQAPDGTCRPAGARLAAVVPLAVILAVSGVLYAAPLYVGARIAPSLARMFPDGGEGPSIPRPSWEMSPSPAAAGPTATPAAPTPTPVPGTTEAPTSPPTPTPDPTATPFSGPEWARDGLLNIVLLGADEGPGRWSLRTDAIFLVSIDIASGRSAVFGFPRYMSNIPLPPASAAHWPNGRYPNYINALYVAGLDFPRKFPDNDERGLGIIAAAVQEIAGVRVDHYAMVNLNGFVQLVNEMGGLWIDVPEPGVYDDRYVPEWGRGRGYLPVRIPAGCQKLDGTMSLAFSRSRHQDGDYGRMSRQTVTINALRRQFDPLAVIPRLPELFEIAGNNVYWTLTPDDVAPMAQVLRKLDPDQMDRVLFIPPDYKRGLPDHTLAAIRDKVRTIFDTPFVPEPTPSGGTGESCPLADGQ